jgi:membrane protein
VNLRSALTGGVVAGILFQLTQWAYIEFQVGVGKYNAIYGSFAALPLFLIWLQLSWLILLFGAEVAFAHQNVDTYEFEQDCQRVTPAFRRLVTLAALHLCVQAFKSGEPPLAAGQIAHGLATPRRLVNGVLQELVEAGILSEVAGQSQREAAYQPALNIEHLTLRDVIGRLEKTGIDALPLAQTPAVERLTGSLAQAHKLLAESPANVLIKDI